MHELGITQSMFDVVMREAQQAGAAKIKRINLCIGSMTGVVGDSVRFYMEFLSKDTMADTAVLNIKEIAAKAKCRHCAKEFEVGMDHWTCSHCGSIDIEITGGRELFIDSIEVE